MKFKIMSNYDVAKNLFNIINQSAEYASKNKNKVVSTSQKIVNNSDVFVKSSEKVTK